MEWPWGFGSCVAGGSWKHGGCEAVTAHAEIRGKIPARTRTRQFPKRAAHVTGHVSAAMRAPRIPIPPLCGLARALAWLSLCARPGCGHALAGRRPSGARIWIVCLFQNRHIDGRCAPVNMQVRLGLRRTPGSLYATLVRYRTPAAALARAPRTRALAASGRALVSLRTLPAGRRNRNPRRTYGRLTTPSPSQHRGRTHLARRPHLAQRPGERRARWEQRYYAFARRGTQSSWCATRMPI